MDITQYCFFYNSAMVWLNSSADCSVDGAMVGLAEMEKEGAFLMLADNCRSASGMIYVWLWNNLLAVLYLYCLGHSVVLVFFS